MAPSVYVYAIDRRDMGISEKSDGLALGEH